MAWAHLSVFLVGGLFVAIPVVLHLVMQRKPKQLIFPALRFIQQRRQTNRRKLQLRHLLLLLLRCLAIVLLAAALARPSVASALVGNWLIIAALSILLLVVALLAALAFIQGKGYWLAGGLTVLAVLLLTAVGLLTLVTLTWGAAVRIGDREAPVAAMIIIDTSPRMEYRLENRTRLEQAQETALSIARQLPSDSQIAVVDSSTEEPFFSYDLAAAEKRITTLKTTSVPRPLTELIDQSAARASDTDKSRKEIYIFTDLTAAAWRDDSGQSLQRRLERADDMLVYVIDVGAKQPRNVALGELQLASQTLPHNGQLQLQTELQRIGPEETRTVQLRLEKPDLGKPVRLDRKTQLPDQFWTRQQTITLAADSSQHIEFRLGGLELGTHQGVVEVIGSDGLPIDDRRYFTVEVQDAWHVLVAAPAGVTTKFLTEALAPYTQRQTGAARFDCRVVLQNDLDNENLDVYGAIALVDPGPLPPPVWDKLATYVEAGGGLAIFLGNNAGNGTQPIKSFNDAAAQKVLPGQLSEQWRTAGDVYLRPNGYQHPIMAAFRPIATTVPWNDFPVFKHWGLTLTNPESRAADEVIISYTNGMPALVERRVGKGRVLTMTTPISDPARPAGRRRWNDLPLGQAWPYFVLVTETFSYLTERGGEQLNYVTGQTAVLSNDENNDPPHYKLFPPGDEDPQDVAALDGKLVYRFTAQPGAYRLRGSRGGPVVRGFSVNLPLDASDLTPAGPERLDEVLGPNRYRLARSREAIVRGQGEARVGREFYSFLVAMLALAVGLEHVLANRFYTARE